MTAATTRRRASGPPLVAVATIVAGWPLRTGYGPYIATRWGVALSTAQRWVREARQAGLLPTGTQERACRTCDGTGVVSWNGGSDPT